MSGDGEPSDGKGAGGGLARRRSETYRQMQLSKFIAQDKENLCIFPASLAEPLQRSPLPVGFPRVPLQDITAILSPLNQQRENGDEGDGHKRPKQRKTRKKSLRPCTSVVEAVASTSQIKTSEQCTFTVTGTVSAALNSSGTMTTVSSEIQERSTEEIVLKLGVNESDKYIVVAAKSSCQVKTSEVTAPSPPADAARGSPTSRESKRRKPLTKPTPGQNVARFR